MRIPMAVAAIACFTLSVLAQDFVQVAHAQGMGGPVGGRGKPQAAPKDEKPKVDEKAYQDALKRIPEKKADPWGSMR
jgi:hypothetical protein